MKADKILVNGTIYTGISENPYRYLALAANRILAVGRGSGKNFIGRRTEIIDLKGTFVIPGFIDSHIHFLDYALSLERVNLDPCKNEREVLDVLQERRSRALPGEWILGRGWTTNHFNGFPHKKILDEIFPENPVALNSHDEHLVWLNSSALNLTGMLTPPAISGAYFGTDPDGSSNGIIGENAMPLVRKHLGRPDSNGRKNSILQAQSKLHSLGIVGCHSMDANEAFADLQELRAEGKLRLRIFHSIPLRKLEEAVDLGLQSGLGDPYFQFGYVKIFSDGALGSRTAWMLEPYFESGGLGIETITESELAEKIALALRNKIAVAVHAIGDRANRQVLNAFEKNQSLLRIPRAPSRIEHAQLLHPQDIPRFDKIGILASMQPYHAVSDREFAERFWGERADYSYAWRSLLEAGAMLIFGSDAPVEHPDPLPSLDAAIQRRDWKGKAQTITPFEAVYAYTYTPAVASGEEKNRGSLEPGKLADFVILSDDPYRASFLQNKVLATAIDGVFAYHAV